MLYILLNCFTLFSEQLDCSYPNLSQETLSILTESPQAAYNLTLFHFIILFWSLNMPGHNLSCCSSSSSFYKLFIGKVAGFGDQPCTYSPMLLKCMNSFLSLILLSGSIRCNLKWRLAVLLDLTATFIFWIIITFR